ncbi:hypothetical protein B0O99DRAFT_696350 [Bisporella sp. PMI_857]|nr:hypothetical protein B0O99DRAFT_696350 [Bisporella sp. PMI_857]
MHNETAPVPLGMTAATVISPSQKPPRMDLLEINLEDFVEDPSKLLKYAIALQNYCREQSRVRQEDSDRSQTGTSSRKTTDDSDFKKKQLAMSSNRERSAILLDPSTNNLTVVRWAPINGFMFGGSCHLSIGGTIVCTSTPPKPAVSLGLRS